MTVNDVWDMDEVDEVIDNVHKRIEYGTKIVKHDNGKLYSISYCSDYEEGGALGDGNTPYDQKYDDLVSLTEVEERKVTTIKYVEV